MRLLVCEGAGNACKRKRRRRRRKSNGRERGAEGPKEKKGREGEMSTSAEVTAPTAVVGLLGEEE
jgi:hypothetical protein